MEKIFNWGVIGPGKIAHKFVKDLIRLPNARLHAVAGRDLQRAKDFAEEYDVLYAFDDVEKMLVECSDLDVVYVATPHIGHLEATLRCLENRVAVICEKPLGMNTFEVKKMIDCANENNTFLMEALWSRFLPTTLNYLKIIELGKIGKVKSIKADFGFYAPYNAESRTFNKKLGGGSLLDIGIYPAFLAYLLLGKPDEIEAKAIFSPSGVDATTSAIFTYKTGEVATIFSTFEAKTPTEAYIIGEKGMIHLHGRFHEPNAGFTLRINGEPDTFFPYEWDNLGYEYEAIEVMKCLSAQKVQSELWSWKDSLGLIEILDKIRAKIGLEY